ncbi:MAG: M48 family metalloprotease, partial [Gammaproteobacteria bacterium]
SYMEQIRYYQLTYYDPLIDNYLQQLTAPMRTQAHFQQPFTFFIVQNGAINAFALPGGYIGLHTGLIAAAKNEGEVAAVVAHEMTHVTQRHIARMFERSQQQLLPTLAAILGSVLVASQNPEAGMGALTATMAGAQQGAINFTRENEEEADRLGMELLYNSGYDPQAMPDFFGRMWEANRYVQYKLPEFLSTHPVTESRIADSQHRASQYAPKTYQNSLNFYLVKARVDFLHQHDTRRITEEYSTKLAKAKGNEAAALRYGYVLGLTRSAKYQAAYDQVSVLRKADPQNIFYRLAEADILSKNQQKTEAIKLLNATYLSSPNNQAALLAYADALMTNDEHAKAREILKRFIRSNPEHIQALGMLAEAQGKSSHLIEAYQTRADILVLYGDYRGAIKQLEYALRDSKGNEYATLSLKARIKELEGIAMEREEKA